MKKKALVLFIAATIFSNSFAQKTPDIRQDTFSQKQRDEIGQIAAEYIIDHPEVLVKASVNLQKQQMKLAQKKMISKVIENKNELLDTTNIPSNNPKNAKVAVIEFFDYNCAYCHKVSSAVKTVMQKNPNIKYIFREFPIFAQRWTSSKYAAEIGNAIFISNGFDSYLKYHNDLFSSGKMEGSLTNNDVTIAAEKSINDNSKLKMLKKRLTDSQIKNSLLLGQKLGFEFTPVFVVMPISQASESNVTVIPGYTTADKLQNAIIKASTNKKAKR